MINYSNFTRDSVIYRDTLTGKYNVEFPGYNHKPFVGFGSWLDALLAVQTEELILRCHEVQDSKNHGINLY